MEPLVSIRAIFLFQMENLVQSWDWFVGFLKPLVLVNFTKKLNYFGLKQGLIPYCLHTIKLNFFGVILVCSYDAHKLR
jgi:hypothetical protein